MKIRKSHKYKVIGIMSGTSLDGLDIAFCKFTRKKKKWEFEIKEAQTYSYTSDWKTKLANAHHLTGEALAHLHTQYGKLIGQLCNQFIRQHEIKTVDLIASHGHTIFHQPQHKFTFQLGDGNALHAATGLSVAFDFRSLDVALSGEGAPLVPIGDRLLFSDFEVCLNLGGIANLSMEVKGERNAFDICFCNMALNYLTAKIGKDFDKDGKLARQGSVNAGLLKNLEKIYSPLRGKRPSLGREGFEKEMQSLLDDESVSLNDRLRTVCESIAHQIAQAVPKSKKKTKILATGGGALNSFLIELLQARLSPHQEVVVPDKTLLNFKEALVFAFLGVLRLRNEINVLKSVTGASQNSCSGVLIG
ncbi:MAG: anhydro-N-acetylmuramic acid kinase [Bacteroidetes bacterium]|nr:anhydro-N-acetylmuramic acid kinase [Bacteroidota bacterium]